MFLLTLAAGLCAYFSNVCYNAGYKSASSFLLTLCVLLLIFRLFGRPFFRCLKSATVRAAQPANDTGKVLRACDDVDKAVAALDAWIEKYGSAYSTTSASDYDAEADIDIDRRINYLTKRLVVLDDRKTKLDYLGTSRESKQYRGLLYDIDAAKRELEYLRREY